MNLQIWDIFNIPLPYLFAILTGYVLASLLAGDTSFWKDRESFEKLLIGGSLGVGLLFGVTYPIVLLSSLWIPLTVEQGLQLSGNLLLGFFLILPLWARIGAKISREQILTIFSYTIFLYPYAMLLELFFAFTLTVGISTYPDYLRLIIKPFWDTFLLFSVASFFLSTLNLIIHLLFIIPLWSGKQRELPRVDMRWGRRTRNRWKDKLSHLKWSIKRGLTITRMRLFTREKGIVVLGLALTVLFPLIVVQFDQIFFIFTPRLHISEEKLYIESWQLNRQLVLTRIETSKGGVYQYYELRYRSYLVTLPSFPYHVNSIYIANPSNYSKEADSGHLYPYLSSWGDIDNLWVSTSGNVSFLPNPKEIKGMIIDFSNVTEGMSSFNITYYQQFLARNITIIEDEIIGEYQNNTRLESYYFYIHNNENATLRIPYFEFQRLIYEDVDIDTVKVYMKNQLDPLVTVDRRAIYPWMIVPPYGVGNLTITLLSRRG